MKIINLFYYSQDSESYVLNSEGKLDYRLGAVSTSKALPAPIEVEKTDNCIKFYTDEDALPPFNWLFAIPYSNPCEYIWYIIPEEFEKGYVRIGVQSSFTCLKEIIDDTIAFGVYAWVKGLTRSDIEDMYPDEDYAKGYIEDPHIIDQYLPENLAKEHNIERIF